MKRKFLIFNFQLLILALAVQSCKTHQSASQSQTRMTDSSQSAYLNQTIKADTASTYKVTHANGYTFIEETQTITEYDTTQSHNPVAKKTETKKNTLQGVQAATRQEHSEGKRSESESAMSEAHNSQLTTQNSETSSSTPVVQSTVKWYVVGGIIIAVITLITTWLARRSHKKKTFHLSCHSDDQREEDELLRILSEKSR